MTGLTALNINYNENLTILKVGGVNNYTIDNDGVGK
jgi:hypothetical protein